MVDLLNRARQHFAQKLPFVLYSKPNEDKLIGLFQQDDSLYLSEHLDEEGFVMAPFEGTDRILIPESKSEILVVGFNREVKNADNESVLESSNGKQAFEDLVQKAVDTINDGSFQKVVLSRKEIVDVTVDFTVIFERLLNAYPTAFKYCWFHPEVGMWMGATPEQLLKADGQKIQTVALAGTQKYEEGKDVIWGEKEKEEQQYVTDFIVDHLDKMTSDLTTSEPYTLRAGSIVHIKTAIEAVLHPSYNLKEVLAVLHPTPAVCGLPKSVAKEFILQHEGYDREYYAGFLGELNKDFATGAHKSDLFVNLRCMQLAVNQAHLYVGCGITKDSVPEMEFIETVNKSLTMKRILSPIKI